MIWKSKQKVNIACLTYQPSPKKKLQGKNYRSNIYKFIQMFREIFTSRQNCSVYILYGADWEKFVYGRELVKLLIISFILLTLMFNPGVVL